MVISTSGSVLRTAIVILEIEEMTWRKCTALPVTMAKKGRNGIMECRKCFIGMFHFSKEHITIHTKYIFVFFVKAYGNK